MQTILLIDDQETNLEYLNSLLSRLSDVDCVNYLSPVEGLKWLKENRPNLIILDYRMPHMNGVELTREIRKINSLNRVPILMVSSETEHNIFSNAVDEGANDFILRPFDRTEFMARVRSLLSLSKTYEKFAEQGADGDEDPKLKVLSELNERYELAFQGSTDGIWDWNLSRGIVYYSPGWAEMIGYKSDEIAPIPASWFNRIHPADLRRFSATIDTHINSKGDNFQCEYRLRERSGEYKWMMSRGRCIRDKSGQALRLIGVQTDITELKSIQEELTHSAFHDTLTGLANRALFMEHLKQAFVRYKRNPAQKFSVLFIDIDRFKKINDTYGHGFGDLLLKDLSPKFLACTRELDTVARLGGDEFTILLSDVYSPNEVQSYLDRIQKELCKPVMINGIEVTPSLSIGVAIIDENYLNPESLLQDADLALYQAKEDGRARSVFFQSHMRKGSNRSVEIKASIHQAASNNEIEMYFQPVVDLKSQAICGFESLMRWHHPDFGLIAPDDFIHIAEESEAILDMGDYALEKSLLQLKKWQVMDIAENLFISVNISRRQILQHNFIDKLSMAVKNCGIKSYDVVLELNEKSFMETYQHNHNIFSELQNLGFKLAIDDFGSGQTSLITLARYPLDYVKIDRTITLDLMNNNGAQRVFDIITQICRERNLETVVEGVETQEIYQKVIQSENKYGQGYLFAAPTSAERITEILRRSA